MTKTITPEARASLKTALFHMVSMWDALRELETELETEVESDQISGAASDLVAPEDAYDLSDEDADEIISNLDED